MYSSPSSSSQQQSTTTNSSSSTINPNLMRYDSAPSSLLSNTVDSVLGHAHTHAHAHQFFSCVNNNNDTTNSNSSSNNNNNKVSSTSDESITRNVNTLSLLHQGSYDKTTLSHGGLVRHSSSPAGLLSHLANYDIGYSGSKGFDYNNGQGSSIGEQQHMLSRLGPQLSFTRKDHYALSQISEVNESVLEDIDQHDRKRQSRNNNTSEFSLSSWDDSNNNNFIISTSSKRGKSSVSDDILNGLSSLDPQQAMELEMATMDRLLHVPQDTVPCKIRAKRGCATHPRSIAERERRTRISGKLKKLQELVPNMDKQTSYADMLDLAVQHIKGLQGQIQKLNSELNHCTCGCKPNV